ncbi:MAG TPA: hypothetical protein VGL39_14570 [Jatrophihabitantaceae bacterium]|jgi:hypothetical protein
MIARTIAGLTVVGLVLAGCTTKVSGRPSTAPGSESSKTPAASTSGTAKPLQHLACPHVVDLRAHLAYDCVTDALTRGISPIWTVKLERPADVNWTMDEGSTDVTGVKGETPAAAARRMVKRMIDELYGKPLPKTKTEQDADITVGSAHGHLIQTLITIDPAYREEQHLRVQQERLWIAVVPVAPGKLSGWYTSVPDLLKGLWAGVPNTIKTLQVV